MSLPNLQGIIFHGYTRFHTNHTFIGGKDPWRFALILHDGTAQLKGPRLWFYAAIDGPPKYLIGVPKSPRKHKSMSLAALYFQTK
jgi:hypothetical protein